MLNVKKTFENGVLTVVLEGRLDTNTSSLLEAELNSSLDGVIKLVFDFSGLTYISSSGLRILLYAHKTMTVRGGEMTVRNVNDIIMDIFDVTGFSDILNIG